MKPNHLINETSPYLLQHAHNPVDWYPWGEEAFAKAKAEDKPILVSIGYAACHWCHVMERESFEDETTAALMNNYFVNIKVDREERPDVDHVYMDAVQAISGSGGWPLNVFLTPDRKPFYGGTYYPPVRAFNRMSWTELLEAIHNMYTEKRNEIESQAENLVQHLINANAFGSAKTGEQNLFTEERTAEIAANILKNADTVWGGFGRAPKFPQTFSIQYLLRHYYFTGDENAVKQALLSLDKMICGGIYDQLGGGFARYSTDEKWHAPHFEKMLYDNALLINALSEAYQLTQQDIYAETIEQTMGFVEREMLSPEGGFYSALDADSEGVEGKFYTWQKNEIENVLGPDAELFCDVYNITEEGNWEHTTILWLPLSMKKIADKNGIAEDVLVEKMKLCREKLLTERAKRIRPGLDDKILLGWNALMTTACCKAYAALDNEHYLQLALSNINFLEKNLRDENAEWHHTWKNNQSKHKAFLDDYAYLIEAYIRLQEVTGNSEFLLKAQELATYVMKYFEDNDSEYFFYTPSYQEDVVVRKKEVYDGATPSGNAVMAYNLFYLSIVFDNRIWREKAEKMVNALGLVIIQHPTSFGVWAGVLQQKIYAMNEIAVIGDEAYKKLQEINLNYIPNKIIQAVKDANATFPLLSGKERKSGRTLLYLCRNYACNQPVEEVQALLSLLNKT